MSLFNESTNDSTRLAKELGVWISPGLGTASPSLRDSLLDLHLSRVAKFNFVPNDWADNIKMIQRNNPNDIIRLAPGLMQNGTLNLNAPDWVTQSMEIATAWQTVFVAENKAVVAYGQKLAEQGAAELQAAYDRSAFYTKAYDIIKGIADAPGNALNNLLDSVSTKAKILIGGAVVLVALIVLAPVINSWFKRK